MASPVRHEAKQTENMLSSMTMQWQEPKTSPPLDLVEYHSDGIIYAPVFVQQKSLHERRRMYAHTAYLSQQGWSPSTPIR